MTGIDSNIRRFESMQQQLADHAAGRVDLALLIAGLEILQNGLTGMPESWSEEFRRHWGVLEVVYSIAVVDERPVESPENRKQVDEAVAKLQELIGARYAVIPSHGGHDTRDPAFSILIASPPDHEELVAEIWLGDDLLATVSHELGLFQVEIYRSPEAYWTIPLDDWLRALEECRRRLVSA